MIEELIMEPSPGVAEFAWGRSGINDGSVLSPVFELEYLIGDKEIYYLSCTVHNQNGLVYISLISEIKIVERIMASL